MNTDLIAFFQQYPPSASAVAVRAKHFVFALNREFEKSNRTGVVYTTNEPTNDSIGRIEVKKLTRRNFNANGGLAQRLVFEVIWGLRLSVKILANKKCANVLLSSPAYMTMLIAGTVSLLCGKKLMIDIRDSYPQTFSDAKLLSEKSIIYKFFQFWTNWIYAHASLISWATKGLIPSDPKIQKKSIAVYNGFPESISQINRKKHKDFTVCFHGLMGLNQDIDLLVDVIDHVGDEVDFLIIGYGAKAKVFEDRQWPNVNFMGHLEHGETIEQLSKCHVGVSFRKKGFVTKMSFPVKVWEYIGLEIPIVISPESEAGDFIKLNSVGFVFDDSDFNSICEAIIKLKHDMGLRKSCEDRLRVVKHEYTREKFCKHWVLKISEHMR